jgi:hypothetical protein
LSITNNIWIEPGLCGESPAINCLSHGTPCNGQVIILVSHKKQLKIIMWLNCIICYITCCLTAHLALAHPHRCTLLLIYELPHFPVPWFWASQCDTAAECVAPNFLQLLALFKKLLAAFVCRPANRDTVLLHPVP